ncbi:Ribonuclease BN [hydrothermal vent metagenome]|uniref:Ribonuclease BN n=1 Tax=hydrothermal vent metagenome TaxID=652676 RepID=A0A3B1CKY5_9ZZZZ
MTKDRPLYDKITDVLSTDLEEKSLIIRWVAWRLKLIYEIAEKFWWDNCLMFAASLAYTTLLSLAPLAAVSLSILSSFEFSKAKVLNFVFRQLLPNEDLALVIEKNIDTFAANAASVSVFSMIMLVFFSIWVLSTIESAFNMIWKVHRPRAVINQFVAYWSTLTFAPILIAVSIIVTAKVQALVLSESWSEYTYLQGFILKMIPYALTWGAFFLVYKLLPNTTVYFKSAWTGAIIGGTLFEVAKLFFDYYIRSWASYTAIYGALATIPIFLFWLYVTWIIVLLGSVIAYAIQYPKEIQSRKHEGFDRSRFLSYYALRVLVEAARAFESGKGPLDPKEAQEKLEITGEFYGRILRKLHGLGLIEFINDSDVIFLFKKPPEFINIADVLLNLNGETFNVSPEPLDSDRGAADIFFQKIKDSIGEGVGDFNLLNLTESFSATEKNKNPVVELIQGKPDQV